MNCAWESILGNYAWECNLVPDLLITATREELEVDRGGEWGKRERKEKENGREEDGDGWFLCKSEGREHNPPKQKRKNRYTDERSFRQARYLVPCDWHLVLTFPN